MKRWVLKCALIVLRGRNQSCGKMQLYHLSSILNLLNCKSVKHWNSQWPQNKFVRLVGILGDILKLVCFEKKNSVTRWCQQVLLGLEPLFGQHWTFWMLPYVTPSSLPSILNGCFLQFYTVLIWHKLPFRAKFVTCHNNSWYDIISYTTSGEWNMTYIRRDQLTSHEAEGRGDIWHKSTVGLIFHFFVMPYNHTVQNCQLFCLISLLTTRSVTLPICHLVVDIREI